MDKNRDFHTIKALSIATNEIITFGFVERNEILPAAPVSYCSFCGTIVISCLVHLKHIVLILLVSKRDKVADEESMVVSPESVVDPRIPALVGTDNVISCCGGRDGVKG